MKKFKGILLCGMAIFTLLLLNGCKDSEEEWFVSKPDFFNYEYVPLEGLNGRIYTETEGKFAGRLSLIIDDKDVSCLPGLGAGDEEGYTILLSGLDDASYNNKNVSLSGSIRFCYITGKKNNPIGPYTYVYEFKVDKVNVQTRSSSVSAADEDSCLCLTPVSTPPSWLFARSTNTYTGFKTFQFRVYVHVIRDSKGEGFSTSIATNIVNSLNSYFNNTNISFTLYGAKYINSDEYSLITKEQLEGDLGNELLNKNAHTNAIDIYVISDGANIKDVTGRSLAIPSTSLVLKNYYYRTSTLMHEVGHCLGLYHTHHGTSNSEGGSPELVDGSNASFAGDFIVDTPADPKIWLNGLYNGGSLTDANGDVYAPDPFNFMSYSGNSQRIYLSPNQLERIYQYIYNTQALQMACSITNYNIIGPDYIDNSADYSINIPSGYSLSWKVNCETFSSMNSSTSSITTYTDNPFTLVNPNVYENSQKFTIQAEITNSKGIKFVVEKIARHVIPSKNTGIFRWGSDASGLSNYSGTLDPGNINSNTIKVYQGGNLYFYYSDASGAYSYNDSNFNFVLNDSYATFTKYSGGNHAFKCDRNASPGTHNAVMVVYSGNYSCLVPVKINILANPNPYSLLTDSLDIQNNN